MITVNSLSGGKTSSYIAANYPADYEIFALVCLDDHKSAPKDRSIVQYVNAKLERHFFEFGDFIATAEDDATLYAMRDLEQFIGREIIWVRGQSFDDLINKGRRTRLPSWARRYCTVDMKIDPIFRYWFDHIGERVDMRIGFRFDEFGRMERFVNSGNANRYKIPVACSTKGKRLQRHELFDWRYCSFPLVRDAIKVEQVRDFWRQKGRVLDFDTREPRPMLFPEISNCVGCFHKKPDTLAIMWNEHVEKMRWFAEQETKGKGTWYDKGPTYDVIGRHALATPYSIEMLKETNASCDAGGCTD